MEIISRTEIIYEYTKAITVANQEFKWGKIYQINRDQNVPDVGLEEMPLYINIRKSSIMKVAMHPEFFPCAEVIGWILPRVEVGTMIMSNIEGKSFASFTPA